MTSTSRDTLQKFCSSLVTCHISGDPARTACQHPLQSRQSTSHRRKWFQQVECLKEHVAEVLFILGGRGRFPVTLLPVAQSYANLAGWSAGLNNNVSYWKQRRIILNISRILNRDLWAAPAWEKTYLSATSGYRPRGTD